MELWVRNQDKERLLKIKDIFLNYDGYHCNKFHLITYDDKKYEINLGTYKTKERALEVLDEIQDILKPKIITTNYECEIKDNAFDKTHFNLEMNPQKTEIQEFSTYVYQMPEE